MRGFQYHPPILALLLMGVLMLLPLPPAKADPQDTASLPLASPSNSVTTPPPKDIPPILTTRPSFTDSWLAIPKGSIQVEGGATFTRIQSDSQSWILPEALVKVGVLEDTEFRITLPNYTYINQNAGNQSLRVNQFGDISLGFSHHQHLPKAVDLAIIPILNLPTGGNQASSNSVDPQLRLVVAKAISRRWVLSSQLDTRWNTGKQRSSDILFNPTVIGYATLTDKWNGFLEYGGLVPTTGKSSHYLQGGLLYLLTKRHQLDIRVAKGLNNESSDFLVGFGYSFRVDNLWK